MQKQTVYQALVECQGQHFTVMGNPDRWYSTAEIYWEGRCVTRLLQCLDHRIFDFILDAAEGQVCGDYLEDEDAYNDWVH